VDRFVSVNSALEVDLTGQVNAEMIKGKRVSGVGGSLDFSEGATHSAGGLRIVALPSIRIVERLGEGSVVTTPRSAVDVVVTEKGAARLEGMTARERSEALTAIAGDPLSR
jgi:acyl-CoA hydrolase